MADKAFRNVINGELVDAASGERYDVHRPDDRGGVRHRTDVRRKEDVDRAYAAAEKAFEGWGG